VREGGGQNSGSSINDTNGVVQRERLRELSLEKSTLQELLMCLTHHTAEQKSVSCTKGTQQRQPNTKGYDQSTCICITVAESCGDLSDAHRRTRTQSDGATKRRSDQRT
jgi:hypothetical protein